jgi:hypothetical protein
LLAAVFCGLGAVATAQDHAITGARLSLTHSGSMQKLQFISKDPSFLFPAIGSVNDPSSGPAGLSILLASPNEGIRVLDVPATGGDPGWSAHAGLRPVYRYKNRPAPAGASTVRLAVLKSGTQIKIVGRSTGSPMAVPQGAVAVIISTGTLRNCTVFEPSVTQVDVPGTFRAQKAPAPAVTDCFVGSLLPGSACGTSVFPTCGGACPDSGACVPSIYTAACHCVLPTQPCGDTTPACNGTCPAGEECASFGSAYPLNTCGCVPTGATPCGTPGLPACGGVCPTGKVCGGYVPFDLFPTCACVSPDPCSATVIGSCPGGQFCYETGLTRVCTPQFCSGTYPTCGGSCGDGGVCRAVNLDLTGTPFPACVCDLPGPCDMSCGVGNDCSGGDVCYRGPGGCGCGAP